MRPPTRPRPGAPVGKARLAELRGLRDKRHRQAAGLFLVEGFHVVGEALASRAPLVEILLSEGAARSPAGERVVAAAAAAGVPLVQVPRRDLDRIADAETPQGVLAVVRGAPPGELPLARDGVAVLLDGVQDPGNAGAIVRAADAFGCASVIFGAGTVEPTNPKVLRAGQGSHFHLPVVPAPAAAEVAALARAAGHRIAVTVPAGGTPLYEARVPGPRVTVVFGNEARGVAPEVIAAADLRLTVPLRGRAESLGVAAAAAVVLSWLAAREGAR